jgi:hypothetical protein
LRLKQARGGDSVTLSIVMLAPVASICIGFVECDLLCWQALGTSPRVTTSNVVTGK